jgi:hypothetical protein
VTQTWKQGSERIDRGAGPLDPLGRVDSGSTLILALILLYVCLQN